MQILDLKSNLSYVQQYIDLRNQYITELLTQPVQFAPTIDWIRNGNVLISIMVDDAVLCGVVILYFDRNCEVSVFVRERGQGIGSALLTHLGKEAFNRGVKQLWAWVLEDNLNARKLFEKNGYSFDGSSNRIYNNMIKQGMIYKKELDGT